ncbi:hypothetical protein KC316_g72 [Hortaea werneckii]|nr:hypothetical protein KC316_g72 [Hortaea werneckii]
MIPCFHGISYLRDLRDQLRMLQSPMSAKSRKKLPIERRPPAPFYALKTFTFCLIPFLHTGQPAARRGLVRSCAMTGLCWSEHHLHMTRCPQGRQAISASWV